MLENRKSLLILMTSVSLGVCVFVVYILFNLSISRDSKTDERTEFKGIFTDQEEKKPQIYYSEDFITPVISVLEETISSFYGDAHDEFSEPAPQPSNFQYYSREDVPNPPLPQTQFTITENQIFEFGYDKAHLEVLANFRGMMMSQGFISDESDYPLTNMQEAIRLQDKFAQYLESRSALSMEDLEKYRYAYRTLLPKLWEQEYRALISKSILEKNWFSFRSKVLKKKISLLIAIIPEANAQGGCYREGINNLIRGSQRAAPCCNCSVNGIPIGCLNAVCSNLPAIYDSTTGICACYI